MHAKSGAKRKPASQPAASPTADAAANKPEPAAPPEPAPTPPSFVIEADVDGKRVKLTAKDEIVLECGKASITLRRNGKVIVRGTHVETYSDGVNRIKGGQVRIN